MEEIERLEDSLGVAFRDRALLRQALVHPSFANEYPECSDNQRLEFLGDAVIGFIVSEHLYLVFPDSPEGVLTNLRAKLVRKEALAELAEALDLGRFMLLGHGMMAEEGRSNPGVLADGLEAIAGAVLLDQGLDAAKRLLLPWIRRSVENLGGAAIA